MNFPDLSGRVAVVTGGARGIGYSLASALARQGVSIGLLDLLPDVDESARRLAEETGVATASARVDVTDAESVSAAFSAVSEQLGTPDILVTAAGITIWGDSAEVEPATWASGFCNALKTFSTGISEAGSDLTGQGIPSSDEIISVIDNAAAAASTFADDLRELGRPDVPSGEEIQTELENAAEEAGKTFDAVKDEIDGEIDNATDVAVVAGAIAEAAQKALTGIQTATNRLQELDVEGALQSALEGASECTGIGS